jgi:hypothetical protein
MSIKERLDHVNDLIQDSRSLLKQSIDILNQTLVIQRKTRVFIDQLTRAL